MGKALKGVRPRTECVLRHILDEHDSTTSIDLFREVTHLDREAVSIPVCFVTQWVTHPM